jgi:transposase InsO family protein
VRDNDRAYGHIFTSRVRAMGIRDRPISPQSPWQNGYAERLIGTLRRECLDQVAIFSEAHLRRILSGYAAYYTTFIDDIGQMSSSLGNGRLSDYLMLGLASAKCFIVSGLRILLQSAANLGSPG